MPSTSHRALLTLIFTAATQTRENKLSVKLPGTVEDDQNMMLRPMGLLVAAKPHHFYFYSKINMVYNFIYLNYIMNQALRFVWSKCHGMFTAQYTMKKYRNVCHCFSMHNKVNKEIICDLYKQAN